MEMQWTNWLDPKHITVSEHDRCPTPELDGQFLGDGFPHCDGFPPLSRLSAGVSLRDVPVSVTLDNTLSCLGDEMCRVVCTVDAVSRQSHAVAHGN